MNTGSNPNDPERWLELYGNSLFRFACYRVSDKATAEDLVQETFLAALRSHKGFTGKSSIKTWLTGILKNKIVDFYRKKNRTESYQAAAAFFEREESELFDQDGHWNYTHSHTPHDWNPEQIRNMDRKEFIRHFNQCADQLPDKTRQVFMMREVDGLKTEEICELLRISQPNLWTILHRARMALRGCLEKNFLTA